MHPTRSVPLSTCKSPLVIPDSVDWSSNGDQPTRPAGDAGFVEHSEGCALSHFSQPLPPGWEATVLFWSQQSSLGWLNKCEERFNSEECAIMGFFASFGFYARERQPGCQREGQAEDLRWMPKRKRLAALCCTSSLNSTVTANEPTSSMTYSQAAGQASLSTKYPSTTITL